MITRKIRAYLAQHKRQPIKFSVETVKIQDLPEWKDNKGTQKLQFGTDVPQDMRNFMGEQMRKGTNILDTRNLNL